MNNFLNNIPRGKEDSPILLLQDKEILMNCEDPDNPLSMLDPMFSGCATLTFSKKIDKNIQGKITLDGKPVEYFSKFINFMGGLDLIGAKIFPYLDDYDKTYLMRVEDFTDTDGNKMLPTEVIVHTTKKKLPNPEFYNHEKIALKAAEEGIVLLENNNNVLPFKDKIINVFGSGLHSFRESAVGAGKLNSRYTIGFKRAIRESNDFELNEELSSFYQGNIDELPSEELLKNALANSDTAFVLLTRFGGENTDFSTAKGEYNLSDKEEELLKCLSNNFEHVVVILNSPCPMDTKFIKKYNIDGLIYCGFPGMLGGQALLEIISGKINPSGHLTDTWAINYEDIPASKNTYDWAKDGPRYAADDVDIWIDTVYEEGLYVGYRYFTSFNVKPAYPFGYGLSYTTFKTETSSITFDKVNGLTLDVSIKNTGNLSGKEVIQVYIGKPENTLEQATKELVEFNKTKCLSPLESEELHFDIPIKHLASFDENSASYIVYKGKYNVYIGNDVLSAQLIQSFNLDEDIIIKKVNNHLKPLIEINELSKKDKENTWPKGEYSGIKKDCHEISPRRKVAAINENLSSDIFELNDISNLTFNDVINNPKLAYAYAKNLSDEQLCRLVVCSKAHWDMAGGGMGGYLATVENTDIPYFGVADGNSAVRVKPETTGFPASVVYCATFNRSLVKEIGNVIAKESIERKVDLILGPGMNLHRHPLNGRGVEYFSEDPYLTGMMAGSLAKGLEEYGIGSCYKHFACNNCETSRKRNQSILSERTLRELYLKAFEYAIETQMPASIMTSYNAINGTHTAADSELLQDILRKEWNFDGYIMCDWNSYDTCDMIEMLKADNNWLCPGSADDSKVKPVEEALNEGKLTIDQLQENATWIIYVVARLKKKQLEVNKEIK